MKQFLAFVLVIAAIVLFAQKAENEQFRTIENLRHERVPLPANAPDRSGFVVSEYIRVSDEEGGVGILILYNDVRTKRAVDYLEAYDIIGHLLGASWIDRFGVCQMAIDRGLLDDDDPAIEGILVLVEAGTNI